VTLWHRAQTRRLSRVVRLGPDYDCIRMLSRTTRIVADSVQQAFTPNNRGAAELLFAIGVAAVPVLVTLAVFFGRTRLVPVVGDEPHYLIMADSVARDLDLDLRNNYEGDFQTGAIVGRVTPHARDVDGRWWPFHTPGLGVLLAVPLLLGGSVASRAALAVFAGLLPFVLVRWFARVMKRQSAAWLAIATCLSVPILFGSSLIFPDLPAGIVTLALFIWIARRANQEAPPGGTTGWAAYWLTSGLLPWLNLKFAPTTIVLALGGAAVAWRIHRSHGAAAAARTWTSAPLIAIGPVTLLAFHYWAYGRALGAREGAELTSSGFRAGLIFLGLHFDQSQGMFLQQPLLLLGVAALVPFIRTRPWMAVFWLMTYLSLIVPNTLELARFGMAGPDGRFGWSAEWLWMIPVGFLVGSARSTFERWIKPLAVAALAYQASLAVRWIASPMLLFPRLEEQLSLRDSLFPAWLRAVVPSYYLWDFRSYLTYPPNVVAMVGTLALMTAGAILLRADSRQSPIEQKISG
jgi:hypothetical protein